MKPGPKRTPEKTLTRFEAKYIPEPNTGCWIWTANSINSGYGWFQGIVAHRVSWLLSKGPIGAYWVLHKCDNKLCVNPDHLFLGTNSDNQKDAIAKGIKVGLHYGHQRKREMTHCKRGHELSSRKKGRYCRTCHAEQERARRRERRECAMDLA